LTFQLWVAGPQSGSFEVQGEGQNIRLEQALKYREGVEPRYRGSGSFHVEASGSSEDIVASFRGSGDISVREGHLALIDIFRGVLGITGLRRDNDHADANFELTPDRVRWSDMRAGGNTIGITGAGDLFYDGRLDYLFNVGPLQGRKGVLGVIGDTVGIIGDRLVAYEVTGTIEAPKVNVKALGVGGAKRDKKE